ncbi:Protein of unknown function [Gryllus bimaculatus]|nr:Protein of unknown function [Gryllus bimaculatus]
MRILRSGAERSPGPPPPPPPPPPGLDPRSTAPSPGSEIFIRTRTLVDESHALSRVAAALREDGAAAPAKSHKVGLRARLLRRMKGWCSYGRSDAAPGLHEEDEGEQEETGYVERPAAPRPLRIRTRDLFNWRREFEMAVGDVLRVAVCGGDAKAKAKAKIPRRI